MMYAIVVFLVVVGIPIFDYLFRRPVLRALLGCLTPIFYVAVPAAETAYEKMEETYDTLSLSVNDFVEANSPVMMEAREQLRDRLMLLTGSKMQQPNFDAAAVGDGDAELGTAAAEPPPAAAASPQVPALLPANSPGSDTPKRSLSGRVMASARSFLSPKTLPRPAPAPTPAPAPASEDLAPAPAPEDLAPAEAEPTYAIGSRVYVKRSSGEEAIAFVKEYDAGRKIYMLELESVGSGKIKPCLENVIRAAPAADAPASAVEA